MKKQCIKFFLFKFYNARTIRPSYNNVYFVYYYTYRCMRFNTYRYIFLQNIDPRLFLPHN